MTKFNVGDEVSFINEKLEGRISEIISGNSYRIETIDGFIIDAVASELVLRKSFLTGKPTTEKKPETIHDKLIVNSEKLFDVFHSLKGFYLLVIPEQNQLMNGNVQWWLFNATSDDQLFTATIPVEGKSATMLRYGILTAGTASLLHEFRKNNFPEKREMGLRWMSCSANGNQLPVTHNKQLEPEEPTLEQTDKSLNAPFCFTRYHALNSLPQPELNPADLESLYAHFKQTDQTASISKPAEKSKKQPAGSKNYLLRQYGLEPSLQEIDLHIEELVADMSTLTVTDMLDIQLKAFRKCLDKALLSGQKELTLIHGVGNGVLKAMIRKELGELGLRYSDAAYERFGNGATRVLLTR